MPNRILVGLSLLGLFAVAGCGNQGDVTRYNVSGTVTFAGRPVPVGTIFFQPAPGNSGPGGTANIKDGRYDTAVDGKGPTSGRHIAVISGFDGKADPDNEMPYGTVLFAEYKEEVDLPKEVSSKDFDVPENAKPKELSVNPKREA